MSILSFCYCLIHKRYYNAKSYCLQCEMLTSMTPYILHWYMPITSIREMYLTAIELFSYNIKYVCPQIYSRYLKYPKVLQLSKKDSFVDIDVNCLTIPP